MIAILADLQGKRAAYKADMEVAESKRKAERKAKRKVAAEVEARRIAEEVAAAKFAADVAEIKRVAGRKRVVEAKRKMAAEFEEARCAAEVEAAAKLIMAGFAEIEAVLQRGAEEEAAAYAEARREAEEEAAQVKSFVYFVRARLGLGSPLECRWLLLLTSFFFFFATRQLFYSFLFWLPLALVVSAQIKRVLQKRLMIVFNNLRAMQRRRTAGAKTPSMSEPMTSRSKSFAHVHGTWDKAISTGADDKAVEGEEDEGSESDDEDDKPAAKTPCKRKGPKRG
jgi:hypothetical protein